MWQGAENKNSAGKHGKPNTMPHIVPKKIKGYRKKGSRLLEKFGHDQKFPQK
jgi:hypothetical protein